MSLLLGAVALFCLGAWWLPGKQAGNKYVNLNDAFDQVLRV
jgi:hypothetical protein